MKLGICGGTETLPYAAGCGFECLEPAAVVIRGMDNGALVSFHRQAEESGLIIRSTNGFFPGDMKLYEQTDMQLLSYAERNYEAADILGVKIMVVGSGAARSVPEGMDRREAEERFIHVMDIIGGRAAEHGITLAIEPLRYAESNLINTLRECIEIRRRTGRDNGLCLLDLFHFYSNGEDLNDLDLLSPGELCHVHIARPDPDRGYPREEDLPKIKEWADKLKQIGYGGIVSLECSRGADFDKHAEEAANILKIFR